MVNLPNGASWRLFVAWLLAALRPGFPFPILLVNGEQGSAKSTLCRMARALVDPNQAALRRPPKEDRDLMIAAQNAWLVAFDNLSGMSAALCDALCALATMSGFACRQLYTDDGEKLFHGMRPIMANGIEDLAGRPDVQDRAVLLTLEEIPEDDRQDEKTLWTSFEEARPRLLGALCDAVVCGLRRLPEVKIARLPRMADFALWAEACAPSFGWQPGQFLADYNANRAAASAATVADSLITAPLGSLLTMGMGRWHGTVGALWEQLENRLDDSSKRSPAWPRTPRGLAGMLRRLTPALRRSGVVVVFGDHSRTGNTITITKKEGGETRSQRSHIHENSENTGKTAISGDDSVNVGEHCPQIVNVDPKTPSPGNVHKNTPTFTDVHDKTSKNTAKTAPVNVVNIVNVKTPHSSNGTLLRDLALEKEIGDGREVFRI